WILETKQTSCRLVQTVVPFGSFLATRFGPWHMPIVPMPRSVPSHPRWFVTAQDQRGVDQEKIHGPASIQIIGHPLTRPRVKDNRKKSSRPCPRTVRHAAPRRAQP